VVGRLVDDMRLEIDSNGHLWEMRSTSNSYSVATMTHSTSLPFRPDAPEGAGLFENNCRGKKPGTAVPTEP
jgi:hypothetical protein